MSMPERQSIDVASRAATDPDGVNSAISSTIAEPEIPPPFAPNTNITLPGGMMLGDQCLDQAEIREMNGEDEEALARLGENVTMVKRYSVLLQRCLVSINGRKPAPAEVDSILLGDRDELLLAIRMATFGNELELHIVCPFCQREFNVALEFDKDVPHKEMEEKTKRIYTVKLRNGEAQVRMACGADQVEAMGTGNRTIPEINTIILSNCVQKINGRPVMGNEQILKMGAADRAKIVELLVDKQPGPQLQDMKVPCSWCSEEVPTPMQMADIFRF